MTTKVSSGDGLFYITNF